MNRNNETSRKPGNGGWCPPGRYQENSHGMCLCSYPQYSVKLPCLPSKPPCYVPNLDYGATYYGGIGQGYITHGRDRIES